MIPPWMSSVPKLAPPSLVGGVCLLLFFISACGGLSHAQEPRNQDDRLGLLRPLTDSTHNHPPFTDNFTVRSNGQLVGFLGGTSMAERQTHGYLETLLSRAHGDKLLRFRNLAWEADTVYLQQRPRFFYLEEQFELGVQDQRPRLTADIVFVEFGQMESLEGIDRITDFSQTYDRLLAALKPRTRQIVLLSPLPFFPSGPAAKLAERRNQVLGDYVESTRALAHKHNCLFVDQFTEFASLSGKEAARSSSNGIRLTAYGHWQSAKLIIKQLGIALPPASEFDETQQRFADQQTETIRNEIVIKNRYWFRYFRPTNWAFLYGNRQHTESSWDPKKENRWFPEEVDQLLKMVERAETRIHLHVLGDNSVAAELAGFRIADDYEISLYASEQEGIANPVASQWDARGRLWVLCTQAYAQLKPTHQPDDKLLILEDTDRDGQVDTSTIFANGLNMPTGFALGDGGAYIGQGHTLYHLPDENNDDRADNMRVVFSGFGTADTHQNINSFTWSPGGDLLFCQGMHAFSRIETPWGISRANWSAVWRLRTDSLRLDPYLSPNLSSDNSWGITFGRFGEMYLKGNDKQLYDASPAMVPTTNPLKMEAAYGLMGRTTAKSMDIEFVETAHLPENMQGTFLIAGYFDRSIEHFGPYREGSGIKCERFPKFLECDHPAFRPLEITIGPDGAIYVLDWFNPIIGHYQASFRHPSRDKTHGRVWRITAKQRPLVKPPDLTTNSVRLHDLFTYLRHPEGWVRKQAKRRLSEMKTNAVIPALRQWLSETTAAAEDLEHLRYEALGVFESHDVVEPSLLSKLLSARDPYARAYATRVVRRWSDRLPDALALLANNVRDEHPRVRMEAVTALSHIPSPQSIVIAMRAINLSIDRPLRYSLTQAVFALAPHWLPALQQGQLKFDRPEHAAFVFRTYDADEITSTIRQLVESQQLPPPTERELLEHLARIGTAETLDFVLARATSFPSVSQELAKRARKSWLQSDSVRQRIGQQLASPTAAVRAGAARLAGIAELEVQSPTIQRLALDVKQPQSVRSAAIDALAHFGDPESLATLKRLSSRDGESKVPATISFYRRDPQNGIYGIAQSLAAAETQEDTTTLLDPVFERSGGTVALASIFQLTKLRPDLAKRVTRELHERGRSDEVLQQILAKALGTDHGRLEYSSDLVQQLLRGARSQGNATRGANVFRSEFAQCHRCHRIAEQGGTIGPNLTNLGKGLSAEVIVESLLWPNRQIKEGYVATAVSTVDGKLERGYLVKTSDDETLVLKDARTGRLIYLPRDEIDEQHQALSLMPEGLTRLMTTRELHDLLAYLLQGH